MANYRLQAVLPYTSGLPEDVATNTIYVVAGSDDDLLACATAFHHFYTVEAGSDGPISDYIGPIVSRASNACSIRCYNIANPAGSPPVLEHVFTMPAGPATSLPYEVALVHTFRGDAPYTARRRGRNYIGPLGTNALATGAIPVPKTEFIRCVADAAQALQEELDSVSGSWAVLSQTSGLLTSVTNGWVDNDFDTQRRRGKKPTSRLPWPSGA